MGGGWGEREEKRTESGHSATSRVAHLIINRVGKKSENGRKKAQDGCHTVVAESSRMLCRELMPVGLVMVHARTERVTSRKTNFSPRQGVSRVDESEMGKGAIKTGEVSAG